mgnify:CR=1 FL=1
MIGALYLAVIGLSALGLYTRASGNYNMLWDNIHTIATRVLFVDFANRQRDGLPLRDRYLQVVAVITTLVWPAFLGLAILAGPLGKVFKPRLHAHKTSHYAGSSDVAEQLDLGRVDAPHGLEQSMRLGRQREDSSTL